MTKQKNISQKKDATYLGAAMGAGGLLQVVGVMAGITPLEQAWGGLRGVRRAFNAFLR